MLLLRHGGRNRRAVLLLPHVLQHVSRLVGSNCSPLPARCRQVPDMPRTAGLNCIPFEALAMPPSSLLNPLYTWNCLVSCRVAFC